MDHPHVASLTDVYESEDQLYLVMECMLGGELFDRVVKRKRFTEKDAAKAVYQMLLAVNYIHSHDVVHRDIKLENFLYEAQDSDHLKLIDFGFSKIWQPNTTMAVSCGTLAYVAPEVLEKSYTSQCDLWLTWRARTDLRVVAISRRGRELDFPNALKSSQVLSFAWCPALSLQYNYTNYTYLITLEVEEDARPSAEIRWSLGVVAFILLFGYMPFSGPDACFDRKRWASKFLEIPVDLYYENYLEVSHFQDPLKEEHLSW